MRNLLGTSIFALLAAALAAPNHGGFILVFLSPFIAWDFFKNLYLVIRKADLRRVGNIKIGIWLISISLITGLHFYYARAARGYADEVAKAIAESRSVHGSYPASLKEVGFDCKESKRWSLTYSSRSEDPLLAYMATFTIFDIYKYNFSTRSWEYVPD